MTFRGLQECFNDAGIALSPSETLPDTPLPVIATTLPHRGAASSAPPGGSTDVLNNRIVVTTGLEGLPGRPETISGRASSTRTLWSSWPARAGASTAPPWWTFRGAFLLHARKSSVIYEHNKRTFEVPHEEWPLLERTYSNRKQEIPKFSEEQIREVLQRVNKYTEDDELNCGACGYSSCREKAVATLRGMAEATMCIPYMRRRSESLRQVVMDVSPNSILILDETLKIQDMSPSAEKLFRCMLDDMKGRPPCDAPFEHPGLHRGPQFGHPHYRPGPGTPGRPCGGGEHRLRQGSVAHRPASSATLRSGTRRRRSSNALKAEMMERTREVVKKQMRVAHEIAHLLGETTAESKMIVTHLTKLLEEEALK